MRRRRRLTRPAMGQPIADRMCRQRRPMWMLHLGALVLADLPVDLVVVLEQQERAGHAERAAGALPER